MCKPLLANSEKLFVMHLRKCGVHLDSTKSIEAKKLERIKKSQKHTFAISCFYFVNYDVVTILNFRSPMKATLKGNSTGKRYSRG